MSNKLKEDLLNIYGKYMNLKIFIDSEDEELKDKYIETMNDHHLKMTNDLYHIDAGFDLLSPEVHNFIFKIVNKLDYKVICCAEIIELQPCKNKCINSGFYMYPRSSISKSKLRLANNVGIIDAGYRGHLIGIFDCIYDDKVNVNKFDRHLQICAPGLIPIVVQLVNSKEELGEETSRGEGGFGSTGE